MIRIGSALIMAAILAGCGSTSTDPVTPSDAGADGSRVSLVLRGSDFDQSCAVDDDCQQAFGGDVCGKCSCPTYESIPKRVSSAFEARRKELSAQCLPPDPKEPCSTEPCNAAPGRAACRVGRCTFTTDLLPDAGADASDGG